MAYTVQVTRRAEREIAAAESFVGSLGRAAQVRWRTRLFKAFEKLEFDPDRYPAAEEESALFSMEMREALIGRRPHVYRILFTIEQDLVVVHFIRHAAQDTLTADDL